MTASCLVMSGVLPLCYTVGNGVSTCSRLIMSWISHGYMLYILWISADFCPEFKLDMSQGEVSFLAPKISLWRAKKDTSFWDIAICRKFLLHKKLRVKALSLSIFCHFDEVILNFWWAIEEKILCSSYAAGMLFWKRHNYRFAKRYGSWLKIKKKQTACIRSSEKNMEEIRRQTNVGYILGKFYIRYEVELLVEHTHKNPT